MSAASQSRDTVVLLVEDDRDDFYLTQDLLRGIQREPHRVVWAASYDAAKLELEERSFDVALVDYRIDGRTGLEFISQVGSNFPHCPMILLTGVQDPGIDLAAQQAGAVDYLAKDSLTTELLDRSIRYARQNTQRFAFLDRVLTNAAAGVISVNGQGVPMVWNRCATDALGLIAPRQGRITGAMVREALFGICVDGLFPSEFTCKEGRSYQLGVSAGPDGGSVFVLHDISSRTRTEQLLRQAAADAEAASQAKSSFLATMSHELRTPLAGILGMARVLSMTGLDPSQQEHLSVIKTSGESLLQIINDILDLSKIESGKVTLDDIEFEIQDVIEDVARLLAPTAFGKGLEMTVFIDPMLPQVMRGDPLRVKQVLTNLVGNAIKFTTEGAVSILAKYVEADGHSLVHFKVCDTGAGIEPDKVELLFKRFSQVDSSNTRRHSGTGLGLALCKELTRLMQGVIWYEPGERGGSVFNFRIGLPEEHAAVTQARLQTCKKKAGGSILLATSSSPLVSALHHSAEAMGLSATWESTSKGFLAALNRGVSDVVIVDAAMSDLDHAAFADAVRSAGASRSPSLLLVDKYPAQGNRGLGGRVRFDATVMRPFGLELITTLQSQLSRVSPQSKVAAQRGMPEVRPKGQLRILMAEDNAPNRMVASALLRAAGYHLDIAEDGIEVVERAVGEHYDVILMDVQMPRLDGVEATKQIRCVDRLRNIPIIGLSAGAMKKDRDNCIVAGMTDYLSKPIDWDQLLSLLSSIEKTIKSATSNAA